VQLPAQWRGEFDYAWSQNTFTGGGDVLDYSHMNTVMANGEFDPFADTLLYPQNLTDLLVPISYKSQASMYSIAARASGEVFALPWGAPVLAVGLEHRAAGSDDSDRWFTYPQTPDNTNYQFWFGRTQTIDAAYVEAQVPLVSARNARPLLETLELQFAVRTERYSVETGTPYYMYFPNDTPPLISYGSPTRNGEPYTDNADYASTNPTFGFKYQPLRSVTLRASYGTAFLPPSAGQLLIDPLPSTGFTSIQDPQLDITYDVRTLSGGNPELTPENSKSWNAGLIWQPTSGSLAGLRVNVEFFKIAQYDKIGGLNAQQIIARESLMPERVTRDPGTGRITVVNTSLMNLTEYKTAGWDLSVDYRRKTPLGVFGVQAAQSRLNYEMRQDAITDPSLDFAGFVNDGGSGKVKGNLALTWENAGWNAGWVLQYFSSYKQLYAAGSPYSILYFGGAAYNYYLLPQGGDTIPAQTFHDAFVSYGFGSTPRHALLKHLTLNVGVKNVFDEVPAFDAYNSGFVSYYGDMRLRSYRIGLRKDF
jgi:iron complex outermembrane receptor protein